MKPYLFNSSFHIVAEVYLVCPQGPQMQISSRGRDLKKKNKKPL